MKRLRGYRLCYRDLREGGAGRLDAFLLGFGLWVYFPRRYPEVPNTSQDPEHRVGG